MDSMSNDEYTTMCSSIETEVFQLLNRTPERIDNETKIIASITHFVQTICKNVAVHQYGSTTFGFGGPVDLNLLVDMCEYWIRTNISTIAFIDSISDLSIE